MAAITAARHVTVALADKAMAQAIGVSGGKQEGDRQHVQLARVSVGRLGGEQFITSILTTTLVTEA